MINFDDGLLDAASFSPYPFQEPSAWLGHLPFASWLIRTIKPKVFVELGSHWGHSYFAFCQAASEAKLSTKCYAVDTWRGEEHAGHYDESVFHAVNTHNELRYANFSRLLRMTFDEASKYFSDNSVELLHIDGLHTYDAVKHDFETWLPKLAPGAFVIFHDTNVREREFGVWKLWEELQARYPNNIEFLHSHGLGVVQIDGLLHDEERSRSAYIWEHKQRLKDYFSALGAAEQQRFELGSIRAYADDLHRALEEKDRYISDIKHALTDRAKQLDRCNDCIKQRDLDVSAIAKQIDDRDKKILELEELIVGRDKKILELEESIIVNIQSTAQLEENIADIYSSHDWRLLNSLQCSLNGLKKAWADLTFK